MYAIISKKDKTKEEETPRKDGEMTQTSF